MGHDVVGPDRPLHGDARPARSEHPPRWARRRRPSGPAPSPGLSRQALSFAREQRCPPRLPRSYRDFPSLSRVLQPARTGGNITVTLTSRGPPTVAIVGDLFEGYELAQAWDEVFGRPGVARAIYRQVIDDLQPMTSEDLAARLTALERAFRDQGITFSLLGEERTFPLDLIPRLIGPDEWAVIETGSRSGLPPSRRFSATCTARRRCCATASSRTAWCRPRRTSAAPPTGSSRPTACGSTSVGRTWFATSRGSSGCWRTTSGPRRGSPT